MQEKQEKVITDRALPEHQWSSPGFRLDLITAR